MKSIDFNLNTDLNEAVRMVKAESYKTGERVVGNSMILLSIPIKVKKIILKTIGHSGIKIL